MDAERTKWVNGHKVEEFYWAKEFPVYVDNKLVNGTFEEVVERLQNEGD